MGKFLPLLSTILLACFVATAHGADSGLTKSQVRDFIETRIETNKLQMQMKRNAAQYDDLPRAFFKKRNALLRQRGWDPKFFDEVQRRVAAAQTALDIKDDIDAEAPQRKEEHEKIDKNPYYSEKQKQQMHEMQDKLLESRLAQIEPTKKDWPAVRPYREKLEQLTDWVAENRPDPPVFD